ncbi:DEAD/DEAH box helicase [Weizmannia acidilactici]|uniref:DEAD/DEAH box helicase n=1 Tax=Weizmannia acidilactici TaxID=2607726 RepID=UPI00124CF346|nr:DEAD/DEAH box helicase [Weizmannia acidilactici]GER72991.1 putative ATP-dependent helicase YwqA [Weizmannia acidilactici]
MRMEYDVKINIEPLQKGRYFLFAEDESGKEIAPLYWKPSLFIWHEESYYGSFISFTSHGGHHGIGIDSYMLMSLLGKESFSSMLRWDWDERGQIYLAAAPVLLESVLSGGWLAEAASLPEEDQPIFELPQAVMDEFGPLFWSRKLGGKPLKTVLAEWYGEAVRSFIDSRPGIKPQLGMLRKSGFTKQELGLYFDEKRFSIWTGDAGLPFSIGIRLSEPAHDGGQWKLETVLRDRAKPDRMLVYPRQKLYKKWKEYENAIRLEQARWIKLFPWLKDENGNLAEQLEEKLAWEFLIHASEKLLSLGVDILLPPWWSSVKDANMRLKAKMKQHASYRSFLGLNTVLDFDWRISLNGTELSEEEFRNLVNGGRRLVKAGGEWIKLDPAMIKSLQALMEKAKKEGLRIQDLLGQELAPEEEEPPGEGDARAFTQIQIELNQSLKKFVRTLSTLSEIPAVKIPDGFKGHLRPYQQLGLNWLVFLRNCRFGAILADDMGLGKTVQLISYLLHVKHAEKPEVPALIICPTSVLGNWQKEFEKFAPDLNVALHYGAGREKEQLDKYYGNADVVLTSYGLAHIDFEELSCVEWSTVALDEAQNIKNAQTKQSRAIRKLKGRHYIALTGTPMENRLSELWTIFDFTNKGYLGSLPQFQKRFIAPIEKDGSKEKIRELQALIKPFLLRRTKKDPEVELNLPEKLEQKEYCPLTAEQAALYEETVQSALQQLDTLSGFGRKALILQMLNRLKQLCNHPALFLKEEKPSLLLERSYKLEKLAELVNSILNTEESCLIFTQYIGMGEIIRQMIRQQFGLKVPFLNGSMPKAKRDYYIREFQNQAFPIFLLSLKAGGTGLNLTAANHVIHYDRWWNPAVENQATDRAHRIGQRKFVHVHKFIATGTLEEKIDEMLKKKQALNDEIIQSDDWITELSNAELKHLVMLEG